MTDVGALFYSAKNFNSDISTLNVSDVTEMQGMFCSASIFNIYISRWGMGLAGMFCHASASIVT